MWGKTERGRGREVKREGKRAPGYFSCRLCLLSFPAPHLQFLPLHLVSHVSLSFFLTNLYTKLPLWIPVSLSTHVCVSLPLAPRRRTRKEKARAKEEGEEEGEEEEEEEEGVGGGLCSFFFHVPEKSAKTKERQKFQEIGSKRAVRETEWEKETVLLVSLWDPLSFMTAEGRRFGHVLFYKQLISDCDQALESWLE